MPDSRHLPMMVLAPPWGQIDNNNNNNNNDNKNNNNNNDSEIFVRLLNTQYRFIKGLDLLVLPGTLPTTRLDFVIVVT